MICAGCRDGELSPLFGGGLSLVGHQRGRVFDLEIPAFLPSGVDLAGCLVDEPKFSAEEVRNGRQATTTC
jgi:hypothetical protein